MAETAFRPLPVSDHDRFHALTPHISHSYHSWRSQAPASISAQWVARRQSQAAVAPSPPARQPRAVQRNSKFWADLLRDHKSSVPRTAASAEVPAATHTFELDDAQLFHRSCASSGIKATTLIQSAWALLLSNWYATHDVCFAYQPPARDVPLVGPFLQSLYRRVDTNPALSSKQFLYNVNRSLLNGILHQGCDVADIQRLLDAPIFPDSLLMVKYQLGPSSTSALATQQLLSKYGFVMCVRLSKREVKLEMSYQPSLMSEESVAAMCASFAEAIMGLTFSPMTPIGSICAPRELPATAIVPRAPAHARSAAPFALCPLSLIELARVAGVEQDRIEDAYPATPLQEGMMTISTRSKNAFTAHETFKMAARLDPSRLRRTIDAVAKEYPILRTRLVQSSSNSVLQVVVKDVAWSHGSSLNDTFAEENNPPMAFGVPLWRFAMVDDEKSGYLCWSAHHAGYDGWMENHLITTIRTAYETGSFDPPRAFSDFIQYTLQTNRQDCISYWSSQLIRDDTPASYPPLPSGIYEPRANRRIMQRKPLAVPEGLGILPSSFLRAAWIMTLSNYSDSDDVIFATTLAGRQAPLDGIDTVAGPTITTVPLRMSFDRKSTIEEYLTKVHESSLEMIPYEHLGLQNISRISPQVRQAMTLNSYFVVQPSNPTEDHPDATALGLERIPGSGEDFSADAYPLNVQAHLDQGWVIIELTFDQQIIDPAQADLIVQSFAHHIHLLGKSKLYKTLAELPSVPQEEYSKMLELNGPFPTSVEKCVHEVFEDRVKEMPHTQAICSHDGDMTYAELDEAANQMATHLIDLGVGAEQPVALCIEKGKLAVVAMLGILKAGGFVVAYSASQPQQRLETLIRALGAKIIIISPQHQHLFAQLDIHSIALNEAHLATLNTPCGPPKPTRPAGPRSAAFLVYTSGSTGLPKAIQLEHYNLATSSQAHGSAMGINRGERVLAYASFLYDVYLQDTFTTLQRGATVCIASEDERFNDIASAIRRMEVTWADMTSTVAGLLQPESMPSLKTISLGGEPMKPEVAAKYESRSGMSVINVYGPAEASVTSACSTKTQRRGQCSNIGPPCGAWAFVVDSSRQHLRPIGTTGELLLEGPLLARHYVNDPEKTAEVFLTSLPWMRQHGESSNERRVYATGDLVRLQPDGTLLYVGRADKQVKINGQRVELGEIESNLASVAGTGYHVACELVTTSTSRKVLMAFVAPELPPPDMDDSSAAVRRLDDTLRSHAADLDKRVRDILPSHMIPNLYLPVNLLPKSPSGKLDRKGLQALAQRLSQDDLRTYSVTHRAAQAPETPRQYQVRELWAAVLGLSENSAIGAESNFFGAGADSVAAMQLVSRAKAQGLSISVATIFQNPTLRAMSAAMSETKPDTPLNIERFSMCPALHLPSILENAEAQCQLRRDAFEDIYPSTRLQEGLLALTAMDPTAYINRMIFQLPKDVDVPVFRQAWEAVVRKHSILRTRLVLSDAMSRHLQVVVDSAECSWQSPAHADLDSYTTDDAARPFEVGSSLSRYAFLELKDSKYFVLTLHHAVYDGFSINLLFDDLQNAYLGKPQAHIGDFRPFVSFLESQPPAEQETYWRTHLGDGTSTFWPQASNEAVPATSQGKIIRSMPASEATRTGYRAALLYRAAWVLTCSQYASSNDLTLAVTLSGRDIPVPDALEVTAPLLTTVPLRVKFSPTQTVQAYLHQLEAQATEMINFQHTGLSNIATAQRKHGVPLDLTQLFLVQPGDATGKASLHSIGMEQLDTDSGNFETYPLNVEVTFGESATIEAVHDTSVISPALMERIVEQYMHMLRVLAVADGDQPLNSLQILNPRDSVDIHALSSKVPVKIEECVHAQVEKRVAEQPSAQAIASYDRDWTYAELNAAADAIALRLQSAGVGCGSMIPLCFDKSSWAIVAMLATLKAGGACTSISPTYPKDRINVIVEDTEASVVLCSTQHLQLFEELHVQNLLALAVDEQLLEACKSLTGCIAKPPGPSDPAFVVFTSGSTGRPKGVVVEHGASVSSAAAHGPTLGFDKSTRTAQFAAYTFDVSIQDIFTTLSLGGTVCCLSEEERMNDLALAIRQRKANWIEMTPTVAALLSPSDVPTIRTVSLGGEMLTDAALQKWLRPNIRLLNTYGPTECAINSTWAEIFSADFEPSNIGVAVGCVVWIASASDVHRLVPYGCVGELLIEGPILARGYLNDATKTEAAFVSGMDWLPQASHARRCYKTGDLVRFREDGSLEFLGRKDQQIKLNGLRIELGEIERQTENAHAEVAAAAADVVQPSSRASQCLVAFVKCASARATTPWKALPVDQSLRNILQQVRSHLESSMPGYMVPSLFIPLTDIPSTASGKRDRKALQSLTESLSEEELLVYGLEDVSQMSQPTANDDQVAVSDAAVQKLLGIASKVLKTSADELNPQQSFLKLGGDSIGAMMLASQCRSAGLSLSVAQILRSRSLYELAKAVQSSIPTQPSEGTVPIYPVDVTAIQAAYFEQLYRPPTESLDFHYNQSWYGKLNVYIDDNKFYQCAKALVSSHHMLRSRFLQVDGVWKQKIAADADNVCVIEVHKIADVDAMGVIISERQQKSLNITTGPVFAADLFELDSGEQYISMVAHHLIMDVVSWNIIVADIRAFGSGATIEPEATSFPTWAEAESHQLTQRQGGKTSPADAAAPLACDRSFWGIDATTPLTISSMDSKIVSIRPDTTAKLLNSANASLNTEPLDLFLAAIIYAFFETFPERKRVTIFNEGHGRDRLPLAGADVTRTIGWFTAITALTVHRPQAHDVVSVIRQVKDQRRSDAKGGNQEQACSPDLMEIELNWHGASDDDGQADAFIDEVSLDNVLADQGPDVPAQALFDIGILVQDTGELEVLFEYQTSISRHESLRAWISALEDALYQMPRVLEASEQKLTLSDVPLLRTSYSGLDRLNESILAKIGASCRNNVEDVYPCSPMQEGILLSQARQPGSYETEHLFEVRDSQPIDASRFAKAWQSVVMRHSSLRTIFIDAVGTVASYDQIVLKNHEAEVYSCEGKTSEDVLSKFQQLATVDYTQLKPPHRLSIGSVSDGTLICRLEASHTITDGFSGDLLVQDLTAGYTVDQLPSLGPVYRDFVHHVYSSSSIEKRLDYWKDYLQDLQPTLFPQLQEELPKAGGSGNTVLALSDQLSKSVRDYCESHAVTTATLMQVAWAMTLQLYTGSNSVNFGYLASGRDAPVDNIDAAVGAYMNMMICRADFTTRHSLDEIVQRVHQDALQGLAHQHVALGQIKQRLQLSGQDLFNTIMSFQKASNSDNGADDTSIGLQIEEVGSADPTEFAIALDIGADDESIDISMDYSHLFLDSDQANFVLDSFKQAVVNIVEHPEEARQAMSTAQIALLKILNGPYPTVQYDCIHTRVALQARRFPAKIAVASLAESLTYAQLDRYSDKLAAYLCSMGVDGRNRIPVCFRKTLWAAVAQLAILKCGACVVPLNADHPVARLEDIVQQTAASFVVCAPSCKLKLSQIDCRLIAVDESLLESLADGAVAEISTKPEHSAFILFTSGSTGRPKGVDLQHSALVTAAKAHGDAMGINESTRTLAYANWNYDVSIQDLWTTTQRGGTVCMVADEDRLDIPRLIHTIQTLETNWADLTPSVAALIEPSHAPSLSTISLGGESVPQSVLDRWQDAGRRVINGYGPAENSINSACSDALERMGKSANIGRPLASHFYVTRPDDPDVLMPLGTTGELLMESPQLAKGYVNEPEKTEAAFLSRPAWIHHFPRDCSDSPRRFYRTGDLVKLQKNGTYVFVGRADRQVKIRGQRVELGEIEGQLRSHLSSDLDAAVDMQRLSDGRPELVCYVDFARRLGHATGDNDLILLPDHDTKVELEAVHLAAKDALPSHMVPAFLIPLRQFPLSLSGKLDFKRMQQELSQASQDTIRSIKQSQSPLRPPHTREEQLLHDAFCRVLSLPPPDISAEDSFLALGGDSILAMQLSREMREKSLQLGVQTILQHPKLCELAEALLLDGSPGSYAREVYEPFSLIPMSDAHSKEAMKSRLAAMSAQFTADDIVDVHPVTDLQARFVRANALAVPEFLTYFTWTGQGDLDAARIADSLQWVIAQFDCLRSAFLELDSHVLQAVLSANTIPEIERFSTDKTLGCFMDDFQNRAENRCIKPGTPLARFLIVQHQSQEQAGEQATSIVIRMTHAQYDGVSMHTMLTAFTEHYNMQDQSSLDYESHLCQGSYMRRLMDPSLRTDAIAFWREHLRGVQNTQIWSLDPYPSERGSTQSDQSASKSFPAAHLRTADFTSATLLKACWAETLAAHSRTEHISFADLTSGRDVWGPAEQVVGCCIAWHPVCVRSDRMSTYAEVATAIRSQNAASAPYAALGWDTIAQECTDWADGSERVDYGSIVLFTDSANDQDEWIKLGSTEMRQAVFDRGNRNGTSLALECEVNGDEAEINLYWQDDNMSSRYGWELLEQLARHIEAACAEMGGTF